MKKGTSTRKIVSVVAAAIATGLCSAGIAEFSQAAAEETDPVPLNLYNAEYTTITTAEYPAGQDYFAKLGSITLGSGDDAATYPNVLQLLVKQVAGTDENLGKFFSALTYDISGYTYDYFTVTVGTNNRAADYTNHLLYKVMVDGQVLAQTTHALAAYEAETLSCAIPAGAKELRLHAQSEEGPAYGESNWANPVLSVFRENGTAALTDMTASGISTNAGEENYHTGAATLAEGAENAVTDGNAIIGAIHGDYGNNTFKFSADYDISVKKFNRFTVDAGMLFGERAVENKIWFKIIGFDAGGSYQLGRSDAMDGLSYHHFDVNLPDGITKIQLWAQSSMNTKTWGNLAWCNATLYYSDIPVTPVLNGQLTVENAELVEGNAMPKLFGTFRNRKATLPGKISFDEGQKLTAGTKEYSWTFTPADLVGYTEVKGKMSLTAREKTDEEILAEQEFTMVHGASVRMDENTGIRFSAFYSKAYTDQWLEKGYEVELGMLIAPTAFITDQKGELSLTNENYVLETDYKKVICTECSVFDGQYRINGVLKVRQENYGAQFTGLAYVKLTKGETTLYKYAKPDDNSRSIRYVARMALEKEAETLSDAQKKVLQNIIGNEE